MEYIREVFDRASGTLATISLGDWITITEMGEKMGAGRRDTRPILREMGVLQIEGAAEHTRHRLCPWVVKKGWGDRLEPKHKAPFDVLSPDAQAWIEERWSSAVEAIERRTQGGEVGAAKAALRVLLQRSGRERPAQELVCFVLDHFPGLSHEQIGDVVGVSQQLVSRFAAKRDFQLGEARELRSRHTLPEEGRRSSASLQETKAALLRSLIIHERNPVG